MVFTIIEGLLFVLYKCVHVWYIGMGTGVCMYSMHSNKVLRVLYWVLAYYSCMCGTLVWVQVCACIVCTVIKFYGCCTGTGPGVLQLQIWAY